MPTSIDKAFRKLILDTGLPLSKFARATKTSSLETLKWWNKEKFIFLSDQQITAFEHYFAISADQIIQGDIDSELLRRRIYGDTSCLPEKYNHAAGSFVRSSYYILKYLRLLYGQEYIDRLLISMKIHPRFVENLDNKINITFIIDLLNKCKKLQFTKDHFTNLANSLFLSIENTFAEDYFKNINNYEEFYYALSRLPKHFDVNFDYDFDIGKTGLEVTATPTDLLQRTLEDRNIRTNTLFSYRPLLFSQAPMVAGMRPTVLSVDSCVSRGDRFSRYKIDFNQSSFRLV